MKKLVILIGLQASGKTSFYKQYLLDEFVHISLDELHARNKEKILLEKSFSEGKNIAIDNTNPTAEDRASYIVPAKEAGYQVTGYYFQSRVAECLARNEKREGKARISRLGVLNTYIPIM